EPLDPRSIDGGYDGQHVRIQVGADICRTHDVVSIAYAEAGRRAELNQAREHVLARERQWRCVGELPVRGLVGKWADLAEFLGEGIEGQQVLAGDRPAAVGYPGALLEIDVVEGATKSPPVRRGAAKTAQAGGIERKAREHGVLPAGPPLGRRTRIIAAAFDE